MCRPRRAPRMAQPRRAPRMPETPLSSTQATRHAYALDLATRYVWDFAGEGLVHRLALQPGEGADKPPEGPMGRVADAFAAALSSDGEHRKLEGLALEVFVTSWQ